MGISDKYCLLHVCMYICMCVCVCVCARACVCVCGGGGGGGGVLHLMNHNFQIKSVSVDRNIPTPPADIHDVHVNSKF